VGHTHTFGDDECLELTLLGRTLHNLALDGVSADQPVDEHGPRLPDSMGPILSLQVHLRILRHPHVVIFSTRHFSIGSAGQNYAPNPGRKTRRCLPR